MKNMKKLIFVIYCLFGILAISLAWRPSTRCDQSKQRRSKRSTDTKVEVPAETNLAAITEAQNNKLLKRYNNPKFVEMPVRGTKKNNKNLKLTFPLTYFIITTTVVEFNRDSKGFHSYTAEMPQDCTFITVPHLLSSVACNPDVSCKLAQSVENTETYESVNSYNLGAKISVSASIKVIEIGGEISYDTTYEC